MKEKISTNQTEISIITITLINDWNNIDGQQNWKWKRRMKSVCKTNNDDDALLQRQMRLWCPSVVSTPSLLSMFIWRRWEYISQMNYTISFCLCYDKISVKSELKSCERQWKMHRIIYQNMPNKCSINLNENLKWLDSDIYYFHRCIFWWSPI